MDWIRENKPLAAILGIIIAVSLGLGYMLFDAWGHYTESRDNYLNRGSQLAGLKGASLAPTEGNLKAKQKLVEDYAANVNQLGRALLILQPVGAPMKDIEFQAKLKLKLAEAKKMATTLGMTLPPDFALGFEDYTSGLPTSDAAAAELSGYLDAVDEMVKLFMNCRVKSLDVLERSKLVIEQEQSAAPPPGAVRPGLPFQQSAAGAPVLERRQVSLVLTMDQGSLQLLISRLANPSDMPFFTNLRLLRIENERQDGPLRSEVKLPASPNPQGGGGVQPSDPGTAPKTAANEIKPPDPAAVDSIPVMGVELLKVRMEIDLVKFLDAAKGVAVQQPTGR